MFYNLHTTWQLSLLLVALAAFALVSWRWPRQGAWLAIFGAPAYLLKIGSWPLTAFEALLWLFVLVWLVKTKIWRSDKRSELFSRYGQSFWLALALVFIGISLSALFSADWRVSFGIIKAYFIAPIIFALILGEVFKDDGIKQSASALFISSAAVAVIGLIFLLSGRLTFDGRLAAWYLSPNHLAMWLVPGIIGGSAWWLKAKKNWQKLLLFTVYFLLFTVLYFTYSYGAWLALAAAAVFYLFYFWRLNLLEKKWLFTIGCSLLAVAAIIIFLQLNVDDGRKLEDLLVSPRSSWQSRLMIWQAAIRIAQDHWLFGIGPGSFQSYYLDYQRYFPAYLEWAVPQPHSLLLAWWLQTGLVGLTGFMWLLIIFFWRGINFLKLKNTTPLNPPSAEGERKKEGGVLSVFYLILMAMMVYILAHGLADTTFWKNDLALVFWFIVFLGSRAVRRAD